MTDVTPEQREALVTLLHEAIYTRVRFTALSDEEQEDTYKRADAVIAEGWRPPTPEPEWDWGVAYKDEVGRRGVSPSLSEQAAREMFERRGDREWTLVRRRPLRMAGPWEVVS